ncbi:SDR family NAD(P)-dependent oxidoreductase [Pseudomonas cichorii]|uniref:SDR family NAD(P)-dependent oxidoreductase n=1 Tax=Pseudomonas cichorii TaxID=36746 RepID=UPI000EFDE9A5|nr:SDR family NAD(P)-dependent oxidoreductase [Pseudomonas cichorii]
MSKAWFITDTTRGPGTEIAKAALATGDKVVVTDRDLQVLISALGSHDHLLPLALDITNEAQAIAAIYSAVERFEQLDVLVNPVTAISPPIRRPAASSHKHD